MNQKLPQLGQRKYTHIKQVHNFIHKQKKNIENKFPDEIREKLTTCPTHESRSRD